MPRHRRTVSASRARRTSRQVHDSTVGTHVSRNARSSYANRGAGGPRRAHSSAGFAHAMARRARLRRIVVAVVAIVIVLAVAVVAGVLAFRGTVGSTFALKNSNAPEALSAPRSGQPVYVLLTAELGSVAAPLDNGGLDVIMLARLDQAKGSLALIDLPANLQITSDNESKSLSAVANAGDAALINTIEAFAKVDIAHIVKTDQAGIAGIVDALGGYKVTLDQEIDDPHAGSIYIPQGEQTLSGQAALTYLRATNLKYGVEDQLSNQIDFAAMTIEKIFSKDGPFATRLESVGSFFQTDYTLADFEALNSWLGGVSASSITRLVAPGYFTANTNVSGTSSERYIATPADMATLIDDLDNGREPSKGKIGDVESAQPAGFTVDVQNGTTVEGAASAAADLLRKEGFAVGDVGNAEQPVYDETLVVYKDGDAGRSRAKAVIEAIGAGRPVESSSYYTFTHDVLLIIGADNKPVT